MPNRPEDIKTRFTADLSQLQNATKKAIGLLGSYQTAIASVAKASPPVDALAKSYDKVAVAVQRAAESSKMFSRTAGLQPKTELGAAASGASPAFATKISDLSNPMARMGSLQGALTGLKDRFAQLIPSSKQVFSTMKRLGGVFNTVYKAGKALGTVSGGIIKFARGLHGAAREAASGFSTLVKAMQVFVGFRISETILGAARNAIHYTEVLNLFNVAMRESVDGAREFVATMSEMYGLDPASIMRYSATFYELASAIEMPAKSAEVMSLGLTKLTVDLASLFDIPIETVAQNVQSGMQGMTRAVRKYGIDVRMATLEQTALSLGIQMQVRTTTEANRQGLRFITMMRQSRDSASDFARTIESPANQLRIMKEQILGLSRSIGNFLVPTLQRVLPLLNGFIMALKAIFGFMAQLMGIQEIVFSTEVAEREATALQNVGGAASDAANKMKKLAAPFDELNVLQEEMSSAGSGGGFLDDEIMDPAIAAAVAKLESQFEDIRMKALDTRDAILSFLGLELNDGKLNTKLGGFADRIRVAIKNENWKGIGLVVGQMMNTGLQNMYDKVDWNNVGAELTRKMAIIAYSFNGFFETYNWTLLGETVGAFINTLVNTVHEYLVRADWNLIARSLSEFIMGAIREVDWVKLGKTVFEFLHKALTMLYTFVASLNWYEVGKAISDVITNINWARLLFDAAIFIVTTLCGLLVVAAILIRDAGAAIGGWLGKGLKNGIDRFATGISTWLKEHLVDPVINAVKKLFGIKSPSTVFAGIGENIMEGLLNGLKNKLQAIMDWFDQKLLRPIQEKLSRLISGIKKAAAEAWDAASEDTSSKREYDQSSGKIKIPGAATGGVVTRPTLAMVAEAGRSEAIIPLDDSPQMAQLVARIAEAVSSSGGGETVIHNYMELDGEVIYKNQQKIKSARGYDFGLGVFAR